jgi:4-hydroxy-tetrahydrodipicolinate synthase
VSDLQRATEKGDYKTALKIQDKLTDLHEAMFCETNPIPVKYAASLMGLCSPETRLPLVTPSAAARKRIESEMKKAGLI